MQTFHLQCMCNKSRLMLSQLLFSVAYCDHVSKVPKFNNDLEMKTLVIAIKNGWP